MPVAVVEVVEAVDLGAVDMQQGRDVVEGCS
jgi:hypothetical protein